MLRHSYVYGLVDPRFEDAIRYIGKTVKLPEARRDDHVKESRARQDTHKQRWIAQLLNLHLTPGVVVLDQGVYSDVELANRERYWIVSLTSLGAQLTNLSYGGEGGTISPLTREKMRTAALRRYIDQTQRDATAAGQRGKTYSDESKLKMSASARRYFADSEARARHAGLIQSYYDQPGAKEKWRRERLRRCGVCGMVTTALAMGRHVKASRHNNVEVVL